MSDPLARRNEVALKTVLEEINRESLFTITPKNECIPPLQNLPLALRTKVFDGARDWILQIGLPPDFPDDPPIVFVADAQELFLKNPHVFEDGQLCIFPEHAAIDSGQPIELLEYARSQARAILKGTGDADFRMEFTSYWARRASTAALDVLIIDPIERLGKTFPVAFLQGMTCIAGSSESLGRWAANRLGKPFEMNADKPGIRLDLPEPLTPDLYPNNLQDLIRIAQVNDPEAAEAISTHIMEKRGNALILLAQQECEGLALGAVQFSGLGLKSRKVNGFRPGKAPAKLVFGSAEREIRHSTVIRSKVKRADSLWIHDRSGDGRDLSKNSVLLIGCGSLGGYVAHLLSRAGVGRLCMTDNDRLEWNNLGRHILGADSVGEWKAKALAKAIAKELPHLDVKGFPLDWRDAYRQNKLLFEGHDLIISTVADWSCEASLNMMVRGSADAPVAFGWLEPHAVAGHYLTVGQLGGCFACGVDRFGRFNGAVAEYDGQTVKREPGGCTHYQSYGPTALMPVASMIASCAIDRLLNGEKQSRWHTLVSSKEHFAAVGARTSKSWEEQIENGGFSRSYSSAWQRNALCKICNPTQK